MNKLDALVEKAALRYTRETLPPHPSWCERASDTREACASVEDGQYAAVTHTSAGQIQSPTIRDVYLERTDLAGFGLGPIEIGIDFEEAEEGVHAAGLRGPRAWPGTPRPV